MQVRKRTGQDAVAAGHGTLRDDAAVLAAVLSADVPPGWIDDDSEVQRRICAKPADTLDSELWWRVAEVARICRRLCCIAPADTQLVRINRALRTSMRVAGELPAPPRALRVMPEAGADPAPADDDDDRTDLVGATAMRLCQAIEEPGWVDPDTLASWVDEAVLALRVYAMSLAALVETPET